MTDTEVERPRPGVELVHGNEHMRDGKGRLVPIEVVKPSKKLEDQLVRDLFAAAEALSAAMAALKAKTFDDIDAFIDLLASQYEVTIGGEKGNLTLSTFDSTRQIKVQVADRIKFGPELAAAKAGVDECLEEWSASSGPEIRAIIKDAFRTDNEGDVQRGKLIGLLRLDIQDARWQAAMKALKDSIEVESSCRYQRFYFRAKPTDKWRCMSLAMATV